MTRTVRSAGAIVGTVLVSGLTAIWIGSVIDAVVWVVGTAAANAAIQNRALSIGGCSTFSSFVPVTGVSGVLASVISDWSARLFVLCGYSRHDGSDSLDHETRRAIHEAVESDPGVFLSALSDRLEIPLSTVRHHVRVLEEESVLARRKIQGKRRYYPVDIEDPNLVAALDESATTAVIDALSRIGPATGSELARALDRDPSTVSHHLARLAEAGVIDRERRGRTVISRLSLV